MNVACDLAALRNEVWKARGRAADDLGPDLQQVSSRFESVATSWEWREEDAGSWTTPEGEVNVGWDSFRALKQLAARGWERAQWRENNRVSKNPQSALLGGRKHPCVEAHAKILL